MRASLNSMGGPPGGPRPQQPLNSPTSIETVCLAEPHSSDRQARSSLHYSIFAKLPVWRWSSSPVATFQLSETPTKSNSCKTSQKR